MTALAAGAVQSVDWIAIAPPVIVAVTGLAVLIADLFVTPARKPLLGVISAAGLVLAGLALLPLLRGDRATFCVAGAPTQCSYVADHFTVVVQLLVIGGALLTVLLSMRDTRGLPAGEFWFLLLASASGAALLPASRDLATLIVALEVVSLPAFALVGLRRGDRLAGEAALKFFLSSVTATAVSLLGVSFVYAATGTLHLAAVATALAHGTGQLTVLARTGAMLTLVGFAFKLAVAPFHFWVPDTYAGAPVPVAAYLSVVSKTAGFAGLILLTVVAFRPYAHLWAPALAVLAALTMTTGNVAALRQRPGHPRSAVRLLAWSSIAQAGYLLVPIAAAGYRADPARDVGTTLSYALMYAVVNLGAFAVVVLVTGGGRSARLADHRALFATRPLAALALAFFLLCLAGLPPGIIGLFAKVAVFTSAVQAGLGWLAAVMAVNVVIALYYYLRWTGLLFARPESAPMITPTDDSGAGTLTAPSVARIPFPLATAIGLAALTGVALSGAPQLILRFATSTLF
ncbi:NADH-quinone oxidoreductase subunit N [Streptantibioticus silvisoli]|uniref:NADH-quinone oxidoreductase subunit N n=1 Tax=Streptantibioticus silvisoli TaxID=2705255 RepID=A0ABT6W2Q6_9ACTN|nr:NADH-quinone oxidoreductase subunit N [Streptantibioticus silvisoli]MDI5965022.1 NADH-quinone oxidoreductase subunit N [Streptantibioticus silvisoli]